MLFNHKVYVQYATKFFILKFDTYQQITTQNKYHTEQIYKIMGQ